MDSPSKYNFRNRSCATCASPDVELTAVCTTRPESAEEARQAFGAKLAFQDFRAMATSVVSPEIDAVAVVVRVPSHYEATKAAIMAGKHVFTEWPLGRNTSEWPWENTAEARNLQHWPGTKVCKPRWVCNRELVPHCCMSRNRLKPATWAS